MLPHNEQEDFVLLNLMSKPLTATSNLLLNCYNLHIIPVTVGLTLSRWTLLVNSSLSFD